MFVFVCFCQVTAVVISQVPKYKSPGPVARALVLALSVCYHARLQRREDFENGVVGAFTGPITLPGGAQQFRDEIRW